jgi:hypothetical protein
VIDVGNKTPRSIRQGAVSSVPSGRHRGRSSSRSGSCRTERSRACS